MTKLMYENEKTKEIVFPLGGIGSGSIGLAGNGQFRDMEIFNRANKGSHGRFTHFAIKAENTTEVLDARVLQSDHNKPYLGQYGRNKFGGYGFGPDRASMAGAPHFSSSTFRGEYPFAWIDFKEKAFPGAVSLQAFNPFIPLEEDDSSLPAAFFSFELENTTQETLTYSIAFTASNQYSKAYGRNSSFSEDNVQGIFFENPSLEPDDINFGNLAIATDAANVSKQHYWYRGDWYDSFAIYWQDFCQFGPMPPREYTNSTLEGSLASADAGDDCGVLMARIELNPGEKETMRFLYTWYTPMVHNYWNPVRENPNPIRENGAQKHDPQNSWKNYYATQYASAKEIALYGIQKFQRLQEQSLLFHDTLFSSSLPAVALDAISSTLSVMKTPTCLRLEDGSLYGFEGNFVDGGCCEGSCTHVWSYTYAIAFLFPRLERSMRTLEYRHSMHPNGAMGFRLQLPVGREPSQFRPCVDGQYATVMRVLREYRISGDKEWLRAIWPEVKSSIAHAWNKNNPDRWDPTRSGVLTGRQHHTLDMELFKENAWLTGMYLGGLLAGVELAKIMEEPTLAEEYQTIVTQGKEFLNNNLYNGEYYIQTIDIRDKSILEAFSDMDPTLVNRYWNAERQEMKYQYGEGCGIDQVLAGWHANLIGLGEIFEKEKQKSALSAIYRHNFVSMDKHFNPCRIYSLNDEEGLTMFSWPEGKERPTSRVPYAEETMHGFEYQAAIHMIQEGMMDEGMNVIRSIRHRYDGERRNPWNEIECGSNYARSMASYALLLTFSGFSYDMGRGAIGFAPITEENQFQCFWSLDSGWGNLSYEEKGAEISLLHGSLSLKEISLANHPSSFTMVLVDGKKVPFQKQDDTFLFDELVTVHDSIVFQ